MRPVSPTLQLEQSGWICIVLSVRHHQTLSRPKLHGPARAWTLLRYMPRFAHKQTQRQIPLWNAAAPPVELLRMWISSAGSKLQQQQDLLLEFLLRS